MKKLLFIALIAAIGMVACNKNEILQEGNKMKAPSSAVEYNADFDQVTWAVNQLLLKNIEFRHIVYKEAGKKFDGDYNVLISKLIDTYPFVVEWFAQLKIDISSIVKKYPLIQIAIPHFYEKWDGETMIPVIYFPYGYQNSSEENLWGYNAKGVKCEFTKNEFLKGLFAVVCEKENIIYVDDVNVQIAEAFAVGFYTSLENSPKEVTVISVDSILWEGKTAIYIFNFDKNGFVLTSASIKNEPIIGYSSEGYFAPIKDEDTIPEGLMCMLTETMIFNRWLQDGDKEYENEQQHIIQNNAGNWYNETNNSKLATNFKLNPNIEIFIDPCSDEPRTVTERYEKTVGYFCQTTWNQGEPYNANVPNHYWAGCAPVAMAQIFYYYKRPYNFTWSIMPKSTNSTYATMTTGDKEVAKLLYDVGNNMNTSYGANGSNTTLFMAWWALKYKYDYSSSIIKTYNYDDMKYDIKDRYQPVFINGQGKIDDSGKGGHYFVADGYQEIIKTYTYNCEGEQITYDGGRYELIHYNFGWGGLYDGWYSTVLKDEPDTDLDWDLIMGKEFPNYKHSKYCLYNIKPN